MEPTPTIHHQLKAARQARGEELAALASRVGMRESILRAVEDGRFEDLPAGIYARAAIRAYAAAVGEDPAATIAACEPFLRPMEDPVVALAYLRGVRRPAPPPHDDPQAAALALPPGSMHLWKPLAAAAIDAAIVVCTLLAAVLATTIVCGVPASAFGSGSAAGFGGMSLLLALSYFASVGGVSGATIGEQMAGAALRAPGRVRLSDVGRRAVHCATRDSRAILDCGAWVAATLRAHGQLHSSHSPS